MLPRPNRRPAPARRPGLALAHVDVSCSRCRRPARVAIALVRRAGTPMIEELAERCPHCGGA